MSVQGRPGAAYHMLHDDTEEDLVGADWHQEAIAATVYALRDLARLHGWPWHVGNQLPLVAWTPGGDRWTPSPDVMVHPVAGPTPREEMSARDDGIPALIVEVASTSTWRYDVDREKGKPLGYFNLGVPEYIVFDPTGRHLGTSCRAWRRVEDRVETWEPDETGRYHSAALGIALAPDGDRLRVFDPGGQPVLYEYEKTDALRRQTGEIATQAGELAMQAEEIARLRRELDRLRQHEPPGTQS